MAGSRAALHVAVRTTAPTATSASAASTTAGGTAAPGLSFSAGTVPAPSPTRTPTPGKIFDVTKAPYRCVGDGSTDCFAGAAAAVADAQRAGSGNEVYFPPGRFVFKTRCPSTCVDATDIEVPPGNPVVIEGSGRTTTHLINDVYNRRVLSVQASGSIVENVDLDASGASCGAARKSCQGSDAFSAGGNPGQAQTGQSITLQHFSAEGSPLHYAVRLDSWASPTQANGCPRNCDSGNKVIDGLVAGVMTDSDIDLAFQDHATVANISFTGDRVGCYVCTDVLFTTVRVTAGAQTYHDGWVCTQCNAVTFDRFTMGQTVRGGKIEHDGCHATCGNRDVNLGITVSNEVMTSTTNILEVGDVKGLLVTNSKFGNVSVTPEVVASGSWTESAPTQAGCGTSEPLVSIPGISCM